MITEDWASGVGAGYGVLVLVLVRLFVYLFTASVFGRQSKIAHLNPALRLYQAVCVRGRWSDSAPRVRMCMESGRK